MLQFHSPSRISDSDIAQNTSLTGRKMSSGGERNNEHHQRKDRAEVVCWVKTNGCKLGSSAYRVIGGWLPVLEDSHLVAVRRYKFQTESAFLHEQALLADQLQILVMGEVCPARPHRSPKPSDIAASVRLVGMLRKSIICIRCSGTAFAYQSLNKRMPSAHRGADGCLSIFVALF